MKKYFMKGTDDEVFEGDVIEVTLVGEEDGVTKHSHLELEFRPEFAKDLIESDVIEEREVDDEELEDFSPCEELEQLYEKVAELEERVKELEKLCATTGKLKKPVNKKK